MDHHIHEHDRLARELRTALTARALEIVYQPTIDLASGEVVAFEVLPRWTHPELGEIPPQRFIPIAEAGQRAGRIGAGTWTHDRRRWDRDGWPERPVGRQRLPGGPG
jgi:EAL domain-containing protein (putative c-di-GMP-specific phosphodiesterase class I)